MIKGAIFDVDGTLLDSMGIWTDAGSRYIESLRLVPEENLGEILFRMSLEEGGSYLKENYHLEQSEREIIDGVLKIVQDFYFFEVQAKPQMPEVLETLEKQHIPMVIATSSDRICVEKALCRVGLRHYFSSIFTCTEVGAGKTEPVIYLRAAEYLGTQPEETLVYEDAVHALLTAKRAGFRTVGVYDRYSEADWNVIRKEADELLEPQAV